MKKVGLPILTTYLAELLGSIQGVWKLVVYFQTHFSFMVAS